MADVRLTATNPEDSSVVPVACNAKGELLLEEPQSFDGNLDGDLTVSGSGSFAGDITLNANGVEVGDRTSNTKNFIWSYLNPNGPSPQFVIRCTDGALNASQPFQLGTHSNPGAISFHPNGSAEFAGSVRGDGTFAALKDTNGWQVVADATDRCLKLYRSVGSESIRFVSNTGGASFSGDVIIGSRNKQWMIVESNGLAHLVEQTRAAEMKETTEYPPLRDIPSELTMVEQQLQKVLEKLRMIPEAGWEVWDGSDTN